jgi:hypothetical protein
VCLSLKKIPSFLWSIKNDLEFKTPGANTMPCECSQAYIMQTSHSIKTRIKKHPRHIHLEQPASSVVAVNTASALGQGIKLQDTTILSTKMTYMDWIFTEATDIELHPNNMNRRDGLHPRQPWKPLNHTIRGCRKHQRHHF